MIKMKVLKKLAYLMRQIPTLILKIFIASPIFHNLLSHRVHIAS